MASYKRTNPGDAANIFVRCMLCNISRIYGELTSADLQRTIEYFDGRCPYTGEALPEKPDLDHLIPHNRTTCGLHMYGNVVPTSRETNNAKTNKNFEVFIRNETAGTEAEKEARIERIRAFQRDSGYLALVQGIGDLSERCQAEYEAILDRLRNIAQEFAGQVDQDLLQQYQALRPQVQGANGRARGNAREASIRKTEAISLFQQNGIPVGGAATFASMNTANGVCWANPSVECLQQEWWIILNNSDDRRLYALCIPANTLTIDSLRVRADQPEKLDISLECDGERFRDRRSGLDFGQWLRSSLDY